MSVDECSGAKSSSDVSMTSVNADAEEDEDALLYGDSAASTSQKKSSQASFSNNDNSKRSGEAPWRKHMRKVEPTFWAILLRRDSTMEILSLPDFVLRMSVKDFNMGEKEISCHQSLENSQKLSSFFLQPMMCCQTLVLPLPA